MAISPPDRIALLDHAYSPEFLESQRHFVVYPVKPGLQACLIEETHPNGVIRIIDALTVVPDDVYHSAPNRHPVYACWLGVIANFYKQDIKKFAGLELVKRFAKQTERQRPFRSTRQHVLREAVKQLVSEWSNGQPSKPDAVCFQTWKDYEAALQITTCWYTQHLKIDEASKVCVDQWRILEMWERWEKRKLPWGERAREYLKRYPQRVQPGKLQGRTNKSPSGAADAFEKRCRHVGLRKGKVPKKRPRPSSASKMRAYYVAGLKART